MLELIFSSLNVTGLCKGNGNGNNTVITLNTTGKIVPKSIGPTFPNECGLIEGSSAFDSTAGVLYVVVDCATGPNGATGRQVLALDIQHQSVSTVLSSPDGTASGVPTRLFFHSDFENELTDANASVSIAQSTGRISGKLYGSEGPNFLQIIGNKTQHIRTLPANLGTISATMSRNGVVYAVIETMRRQNKETKTAAKSNSKGMLHISEAQLLAFDVNSNTTTTLPTNVSSLNAVFLL